MAPDSHDDGAGSTPDDRQRGRDDALLKSIPESIFADDDGAADAKLAQALIKYSGHKGSLADVVDALTYARVLIPVLASGDSRHIGKHGVEQDEVASTGVVAVHMPDGRAALPVFTDVDAMKEWNPHARPIPAEGPRAALAAIAEDWSVLVLNPAMEAVVIPRPAVWAMGQGQVWKPAADGGVVAADVREAVSDALAGIDGLSHVECHGAGNAEVTVVLALVEGLTQRDVSAIVSEVQQRLAESDLVAQRIDSLELTLTQA